MAYMLQKVNALQKSIKQKINLKGEYCMKRGKKITVLLVVFVLFTLGTLGCASKKSETYQTKTNSNSTTSNDPAQAETGTDKGQENVIAAKEPTLITFAFSESYPVAFTDDDGSITGCDIEILKLVDEKLKDYEFKFLPTSYDDIYIGLSTGAYDAGLTNAFWTKERNEKYTLPEENVGACPVGVLYNASFDNITGLEDVSKKGLKFTPLLAGNGLFYVLEKYNEAHPDAKVDFDATDDANIFTNAVIWVSKGRYDATLNTKDGWDLNIQKEDGSLHQYADKLKFVVQTAVSTYTVYRKDIPAEYVDVFNKALREVKDEGKASEIVTKFKGEDVFLLQTEK